MQMCDLKTCDQISGSISVKVMVKHSKKNYRHFMNRGFVEVMKITTVQED